MDYQDYYKILGVSKSADDAEIKKAYRKLARKYHPDVSKEKDADAKFKQAKEAYEVLKDPEKRKFYESYGENWKQAKEGGFSSAGGGGGGRPGFSGFSGGDTSGHSDFFSSMFGGGGFRQAEPGFGQRRQRSYRARGQDLTSKVTISLEDAYNGASRSLRLQVPCTNAQGITQTKLKTLSVKIPKGVTQGQKIRLSKQGGAGVGGGANGDLYLEINFEKHPYFDIDDKDVLLQLPITPWEAALGAKVTVPTVTGKVALNIAAGSESGKKMRLKGKGLPAKVAGDLFVILNIITPKADNDDDKAFYQSMAEKFYNFSPRDKIA